ADWSRSRAGNFARSLCDGMFRAEFRIEIAPASVAIEGHGEAAVCALDADHARISRTRSLDRVGLHHVIVLLPDPALTADVRADEKLLQIGAEIAGSGKLDVFGNFTREGWLPSRQRALVDRSFVGQSRVGNLRDNSAVLQHAQLVVRRDLADLDG